MGRHLAAAALLVCLLLALVSVGCGDKQLAADSSDLTAGHRAELVSLGGAWLNPEADSSVTFRAGAGELKIIADVRRGAARSDPEPSLRCVLHRLQVDGAAVTSTEVRLEMNSSPKQRHTLFVLHSAEPLEPGTYRLSYRGDGRLLSLGIGAQY